MEEKKQYVRVLQWRKPSYILTIPPALVLRMGLKLGQGVVLDEHKGMLIGVPSRGALLKKDIRTAEKFAVSSGAEVTEEDPTPLDRLRL